MLERSSLYVLHCIWYNKLVHLQILVINKTDDDFFLFLSIFHHNTGVVQVLGECNRVDSFGWCNFSKFHCNGRIMVNYEIHKIL